MASLDWPAFGEALWNVSDTLGIRPEWQLPVIALETAGTFSPASINPTSGCVGLNQFCHGPHGRPGTYERFVHVPVDEYRQWPASRQLAGPILDYWRQAQGIGPIRSATRLMLAQLAPGQLARLPSLENVVYRAPSGEYEGNKNVFDTAGKGFFTVQDLADAMEKQARSPAVREALEQAYAMRPGERMRDPVYGDDFERIRPPAPPVARSRPSAVFVVGTTLFMMSIAASVAREMRVRQ